MGREVDEELSFHLEMCVRELVEEGLPVAEARARARERFGDVAQIAAQCRRQGDRRERARDRRQWLDEARSDLRFTLRQLRRERTFTIAAVLTLALGIGVTVAIFTIVRAVLLRPLPFPASDQLVHVATTYRGEAGNVSVGNYGYIKAHTTVFSELAACAYVNVNLADDASPERVRLARVSRELVDVFAINPLYGRWFSAEEDAPGGPRVAVLSYPLFARRYGADPSVIGRTIHLNGEPYDIVGVMPRALDLSDDRDLWVPIAFTPQQRAEFDGHYLDLYGRLRPGASRLQVETELASVARGLERDHPVENQERGVVAVPLLDVWVGAQRQRLAFMFAAGIVVLVIACANVAGLLLVRGAARRHELAVRAALGAGRGRIVRQLLTEALVLSAGGAVAGLAIARWIVSFFVSAEGEAIPRLRDAGLDVPVLAICAGVTLGVAVIVGLWPAWRAARSTVADDVRSETRGASLDRPGERARQGLVFGEVALAVLLTIAAGLLVRSAERLGRVDPGFDPNGLASARVTLPAFGYPDATASRQAFERILERLSGSPGVARATLTSQGPLQGGMSSNGLIPEGRAVDPAAPLKSMILSRTQFVTPGYFETLRIPLRRGRTFTTDDRRDAARVMIVNETLVRNAWPGEDALGKRVACCEQTPDGQPAWKVVVGVVADVRSIGLADDVRPEFYLPLAQAPDEAWLWIQRTMMLIARPKPGAEGLLIGSMRPAVAEVDATLPLFNVMTMNARVEGSTARARLNMWLLTLLGSLGLALSAVGIYGVVAHTVGLRVREIGVRLALGARRLDVAQLVARRTLLPAVLGLLAGAAAALAASRVMRGLVFEVRVDDPGTYLGALAIVAVVICGAGLGPVRRAVRIDPTRTLRP